MNIFLILYYIETGFKRKLSLRQLLIKSKRLGKETCSCLPIFISIISNPNDLKIVDHSSCDLKRTPTPKVFAFNDGIKLAINLHKLDKIELPVI